MPVKLSIGLYYCAMAHDSATPNHFFRWSIEDLNIDQYGKLIEEQNRVVEFWNEDRSPSEWLGLPEAA